MELGKNSESWRCINQDIVTCIQQMVKFRKIFSCPRAEFSRTLTTVIKICLKSFCQYSKLACVILLLFNSLEK